MRATNKINLVRLVHEFNQVAVQEKSISTLLTRATTSSTVFACWGLVLVTYPPYKLFFRGILAQIIMLLNIILAVLQCGLFDFLLGNYLPVDDSGDNV